ncbi:MAG: DinB family protein [Thermoanaerobaculia bacterium]
MTRSPLRPQPSEYAEFYRGYVDLVPEVDILEALEQQRLELLSAFGSVGADREKFRYAPGKWSIREVAGHLIDSERVFAYRALSFAREEGVELPGFDENQWSASAGADAIPLAELSSHFDALRRANLAMFRAFPSGAWERSGVANQVPITVRALAWIMAGHARHHLRVLEERYGVRRDG